MGYKNPGRFCLTFSFVSVKYTGGAGVSVRAGRFAVPASRFSKAAIRFEGEQILSVRARGEAPAAARGSAVRRPVAARVADPAPASNPTPLPRGDCGVRAESDDPLLRRGEDVPRGEKERTAGGCVVSVPMLKLPATSPENVAAASVDSPRRRRNNSGDVRTVAVAQLVERQVVVLDVAGSSPVGHPESNAER